MKKLPKSHMIPNTYNLPIHDQENKNNCSSHTIAASFEYQLSTKFKERILVDVDDLWEKQKRFGTATEEGGDSIESSIKIATKYGIKIKTDSGKKGTFIEGRIIWD